MLVHFYTKYRIQLTSVAVDLIEHSKTLLDFGYSEIGDVHQLLSSFLDGLNGWLVGTEFCLKTLVFLLQVLNTGQVATIIVGGNQQFLLFNPRFLKIFKKSL